MLNTTKEDATRSSAWRQLGKIKLGVKVSTGYKEGKCQHAKGDGGCFYCTRPSDLDYFVIPETWQEKLGKEPKELDIVLMNQTLEQCFNTKRIWYLANGQVACSSEDGATAHRWMKAEGATKHAFVAMACPGAKCQYHESKSCKDREYLTFGIPASGAVGEFILISGSRTSSAQIYKALQTLENVCKDLRRPNGIAGIRMTLRRVPKTFLIEGQNSNGKKTAVTKSVAVIDIDWGSLLDSDKLLLGPVVGFGQLTAPQIEPEVQEAIVVKAEAAEESE